MYMWYNIGEKNLIFKRHAIRKSLLKIWAIVKHKFYSKIPTWIAPIEALRLQNLTNWKNTKTYKEFLYSDGTLKTVQEL